MRRYHADEIGIRKNCKTIYWLPATPLWCLLASGTQCKLLGAGGMPFSFFQSKASAKQKTSPGASCLQHLIPYPSHRWGLPSHTVPLTTNPSSDCNPSIKRDIRHHFLPFTFSSLPPHPRLARVSWNLPERDCLFCSNDPPRV